MKDSEKFVKLVGELGEKWDISGVVAVRDREGFAYERAFGFADRDAGRGLTVGDRFCLDARGSLFLTLCVMDLAERRLLRLGDRLDRFIPEYGHAGEIALRDLLRWRSGIPDYWRAVRLPEIARDPAHAGLDGHDRFRREFELHASDTPFRDVLAAVDGLDLTHVPGREDDGSESTSLFLAEIIRRVSGEDARDYLFRRFFVPLGMTGTRPGNDSTTALYGTVRDTDLVRLPAVSNSWTFTTTARDMGILSQALARRELLSESSWQTMLKADSGGYGMGFFRRGELWSADLYPGFLRETCHIRLNFEEGLSMLTLLCEELRFTQDAGGRWSSFQSGLSRAWQDTRVYPLSPELKRVNSKNVWDAMDIELDPSQLAFVPEASRCVASMLARRQPVYILTDRGLTVGLVALTIKPKEKRYSVSFVQIDRRYQHRGYGRIMLDLAIDILRAAGAREIKIGVNRFNTPAHSLYLSAGFRDSEIYDEFIDMKLEV